MKYNFQSQHDKKKYHAFERITLLLDRNSFCEIGSGIVNYESNDENVISYDGVITGYGLLNGITVYVFAQDFSMQGGTIGIRHGKKIAHLIKLAIQNKSPIIGIYDSGGARINEGINSLAGCGEMMHYNTLASGYIPQISVIVGPCAGAAAYSPAITDFVFCVDRISNMYITGPSVVASVIGEECTTEELGGARIHSSVSGVAHFEYDSEKECFRNVRKLVTLLPSCYEDSDENKMDVAFENQVQNIIDIIPEKRQRNYDIKDLINQILEIESFFEVHEKFAPSLVVGFGKLGGKTVGIVANQPICNGGILDCNSSDKGARFVRFCDAFNIPIVTFVDTPGYMPGMEQEHNGIIRHGAKLLFAYSEATTIKITIVVRKAYGGAYIAMGSKHLGADFVYALPDAEIAVMGADSAVKILYRKELDKVKESEKDELFQKKVDNYSQKFLNAKRALQEGYVDEILELTKIPERLYHDIYSLQRKKSLMHINKKHGNIPL